MENPARKPATRPFGPKTAGVRRSAPAPRQLASPARLGPLPAIKARALVQQHDTAELVAAFLESRNISPAALDHYRWALRQLQRAFPILPLEPGLILAFVQGAPLAVTTRRFVHAIYRVFYAWLRRDRDPLAPALSYHGFGRKRRRRTTF